MFMGLGTATSIAEIQAQDTKITGSIAPLQAQSNQLQTKETIPAGYEFKRILKYGQKSEDIKYLQVFLKSQGTKIYPKGTITGYFDGLTKKAVIRFQKKHAKDPVSISGLTKERGVVGPKTLAMINAILRSDALIQVSTIPEQLGSASLGVSAVSPHPGSNVSATQTQLNQDLASLGVSAAQPIQRTLGTDLPPQVIIFGGTVIAPNDDFTTTFSVTSTGDTVAPVISAVSAVNVSAFTATITWTTDEPADSRVNYGPTTAMGTLTPLVSTLTTTHSINLFSLSPSAKFYYVVISKDAAGNSSISTQYAFTTAYSDTIPPLRSNAQPTGTLPADTTSATISFATNETATCRYSATANTSYNSMENTFTDTNALSHSTTVRGFANGTTYNYYARCKDWSGSNINTDDFAITFNVAQPQLNQPPVLEPIGDKSVDENALLSFSLLATDADGDSLIYAAVNLPAGATLVGQDYAWTPNYEQAGSYKVTFSVSDAKGGVDSEVVTITVTDVNRAPVLNPIGNQSVDENSLLSFTLSATDPDGDTLSYSATNLPTGAGLAGSTFNWTPSLEQAGSYNVTFSVSDGKGGSDSEAITITINPLPDTAPPETTITAGPDEGSTINTNTVTFGFSGTDNRTLTANLVYAYQLDASPWSAYNVNTSVTLTNLSEAAHSLSVKAKDEAGNEDATPAQRSFTAQLPDTTAPLRSNAQPTGTLLAGTTQATLSLTTDEDATCRYSILEGTSYGSMTNTFAATGGTSHSSTESGLTNGNAYNYYIRCQDTAGNANTDDFAISFSVASTAILNSPYGVNDWNWINDSMQAMQEAGAKWMRVGINWPSVEAVKGTYVWSRGANNNIDFYFSQAQKYGMKVSVVIYNAPDWAKIGTKDTWRDTEAFAKLIRELLNRYPGKIAAVEVLNEDSTISWPNTQWRDAYYYLPILKAAYQTVKSIDPDIIVTTAALWADPVGYLEDLYQIGAKDYFDVVNFHYYPGRNSPATNYTWLISHYRKVMEKYGDSNKSIWLTEFGWTIDNEGQAENSIVSPQEQSDYMTYVLDSSMKSGFVDKVFWYDHHGDDGMTLVHTTNNYYWNILQPQLVSSIGPSDTALTVSNTTQNTKGETRTVDWTKGWPRYGTLIIDGEKLNYTLLTASGGDTIVSGLTRGANGTQAASHTSGIRVLSQDLTANFRRQAYYTYKNFIQANPQWDASKVASLPDVPPPASSAITISNNGFEQGTSAWGGNLTIDSSQSYSGNSSAKVTNTTGMTVRAWHTRLPVEPGKSYFLKAWVKIDPSGDYKMNAMVTGDLQNSAGTYLTNIPSNYYIHRTEGGWREIHYPFKAPAEATQLVLYVFTDSGIGTAWFDDISIEPYNLLADTTAPLRSNAQPTGTLAAGTAQATLSLSTDEDATVSYSLLPNISYDSMVDTFSSTRGKSHSTIVTGLSDGNTYTYYIKAKDSAGNTNTDDFIISFSVAQAPLNQAPVLGPIGNKSVNENTLLSFSLSATDADKDTLTYSATDLPQGATFVGSTFSWSPTYTQAGSYDVTFAVSDGKGGTDSEVVTITVTDINRAPVLEPIGNKSVNEGEFLGFILSATDLDNDTLTYSATNLPAGASLAGQDFSLTPASGQAGSYNVTFTVSDGKGSSDSETITVTVNDINRAPVLDSIGNKSMDENALLSFTLSAADTDGDTLTYSATNLPTGANFVGQDYSWTPTYTQAGSYNVTFSVSDGKGGLDSEIITITVNDVNREPVLDSIGNKSVNENSPLTFSLTATDADGDTLTYSATDLPTGAILVGATFNWTPDSEQTGAYPVTFSVSDGKGGSDAELITITVNDIKTSVAFKTYKGLNFPWGLSKNGFSTFNNWLSSSYDEETINSSFNEIRAMGVRTVGMWLWFDRMLVKDENWGTDAYKTQFDPVFKANWESFLKNVVQPKDMELVVTMFTPLSSMDRDPYNLEISALVPVFAGADILGAGVANGDMTVDINPKNNFPDGWSVGMANSSVGSYSWENGDGQIGSPAKYLRVTSNTGNTININSPKVPYAKQGGLYALSVTYKGALVSFQTLYYDSNGKYLDRDFILVGDPKTNPKGYSDNWTTFTWASRTAVIPAGTAQIGITAVADSNATTYIGPARIAPGERSAKWRNYIQAVKDWVSLYGSDTEYGAAIAAWVGIKEVSDGWMFHVTRDFSKDFYQAIKSVGTVQPIGIDNSPYFRLAVTNPVNQPWFNDAADYYCLHIYRDDGVIPDTSKLDKPFILGEFGADWKCPDGSSPPEGCNGNETHLADSSSDWNLNAVSKFYPDGKSAGARTALGWAWVSNPTIATHGINRAHTLGNAGQWIKDWNPEDTTPPTRSNAQPTGTLPSGTTQATLTLTTDEDATVRYSLLPNIGYDSMSNTFSNTGSQSHSTLVTGLSDGRTYTYYIKAKDTSGNANTDDFIISFSVAQPSLNQPPVLTSIGNKSIDENSLLSFTLSATDADGDTLTYSAVNLPLGAGLAGATFSWTPAYEQAGSYNVSFSVSDGKGGSDSEVVTITVNDINRAPVLEPIGNKSVNEGEFLGFILSATDLDNDTLTYSATNLPTGSTLVGQDYAWTPTYEQAGSYNVTFTVSDGKGSSDSETITVTVNDINRAPALDSIGNKSVDENALLSFNLSATDADGDTLTYAAVNLPAGAGLAGASFSWTPNSGQTGSYSATFSVNDGKGGVDSETITITVNQLPDTTAPDTTITNGPSEGSIINTNTVTFGSSGTDNRTSTNNLVYSYQLDAVSWSAYSANTSVTLTNLSEASHTFQVKARDEAGNEDTIPAQRTFTIKLPPPSTESFTIEAESFTTQTGVAVKDDAAVSGGKYIEFGNNTNLIRTNFSVSKTANYLIVPYAYFDSTKRSGYIGFPFSIDSKLYSSTDYYQTWDPDYDRWIYVSARAVPLTAGTHQLQIASGGWPTRLDFVVVHELTSDFAPYPYPLFVNKNNPPFNVNRSADAGPNRWAYQAKSTGNRAFRMNYRWEQIEPIPGFYQWDKNDAIVSQLKKIDSNWTILMLPSYGTELFYGPSWSSPAGPVTPEIIAAFGRFVGETVKHFGTENIAYEIINEPNQGRGGWEPYQGRGSPTDYAALLKSAYTNAKQANPQANIIFGGPEGIPIDWIQRAFQAGALGSFDEIAIHPYTSFRSFEELGQDKTLENFAAFLKSNSLDSAKAWWTEYGTTRWRNPQFNTQARLVSRGMLLGLQYGCPVGKMTPYISNANAFTTVVNGTLTNYDTGNAYKFIEDNFGNAVFGSSLRMPPDVRALIFRRPDDQIIAIWSLDTPAQNISLQGISQAELYDYQGNQQSVNVSNNAVTLAVVGDIQYLIIPAADKPYTTGYDYGPNLAAASSGAKVSASSANSNYPARYIIDGIPNASARAWSDNTPSAFPDWVEIDFGGEKIMDTVILYTFSNNATSSWQTGGLRDFDVQVWQNNSWQTIKEVRSNYEYWVLKYQFAPVTTSKIRILIYAVNNGLNNSSGVKDLYSRLYEVEAYRASVADITAP